MKLLFDANLSHKLASRLADVFPESSHVRLVGLEVQSDLAIWDYAKDQGLTIVTLDEDFYDLSC
jgi:predicted nuclease of predicted toxin-antitoxin system